jgi:hypothetical protein
MSQQQAVLDDYNHEVGSRVKVLFHFIFFFFCSILFTILKDLILDNDEAKELKLMVYAN